MSPDETNGPPQAIPSNDWWKTAQQVIGSVADYQIMRLRANAIPAQGGSLSSNVDARNIPIGQAGVNVQAASTPGGIVIPFAGGVVVSPLAFIVGSVAAIGGALLLWRALKK